MLALFLAQNPISENWQVNFLALLAFIYLVQNIWNGFKRKPAVDEIFEKRLTELGEATEKRMHAEGSAIERRMQAQSLETDKKIEALDRRRESGEKEVRQLINDQVSQMEKFISKQITDNRESSTGKFSAIFAKLDQNQVSLQALSNDVMHQIGRLEGRLEGKVSTA
jgi:hypothetical protein